MIREYQKIFVLTTENTEYMFRILPTGHPEHLYYGRLLGQPSSMTGEMIREDAEALAEKRVFAAGNMIAYDAEHPELTLEDLRLEFSSNGKGDIREPFVEVTHADGSRTSDFLYESHSIESGKPALETLPGSYADREKDAEHLKIVFRDRVAGLRLELHYYVFAASDVISRNAVIFNDSAQTVMLDRLMSLQLDLGASGYVVTTFGGAWAREMHRHDMTLGSGKIVNSSLTGTSSNRANPFMMISNPDTTEECGSCFGFNLIYSGNHYASAEVNAYGKTRFISGINPQSFGWKLEPDAFFEAPEAVMTYSDAGYSGISRNMHKFVREHIVRGEWKHKPRPVLLNSWEAAYFKIDELKLLRLAQRAKEVGIELFVMDDGWFGARNDDTSSLGDWEVNRRKIPEGLDGLANRIHRMGMDFGIWIEPEMTNTDSDFYRQHPDWTMAIPGRPHAEGRNQRILDLANPAVVDAVADKITALLSSARINYVKWDMNRIMSDIYSPYLPADRQRETAHRYIMGFYNLAARITGRFPHILFEGCAAGGNRFDLGVLCYMPQIWASDDTDAAERVLIQEGYSYGYPMSVLSAHVSSCPNHQTLRSVPVETRYHVAAFGLLGYELNLTDLSDAEREEIRNQITLYKESREVLQNGRFYRGRQGNIHEWTCVSEDQELAIGMIFQEKVIPNMQFEQYFAHGLAEEKRYHLYNLSFRHDIRKFGDLVNAVSPIHVRKGSVLHNVLARFVTMPGETEDVKASGTLLMHAGVKLQQAYSATGYNENTRYFTDYCSRMYFMEADSTERTSNENDSAADRKTPDIHD